MRRIAVVTGSRAEYGILYSTLRAIQDSTELDLVLIVTGMHLSAEFGMTVDEITRDGFPIAERVEMLLSSDTASAVALSMGVGMMGFARAYGRLKPDILLVTGDRFETFSAVAAAAPFGIPVAHLHGGEVTEGSVDELFRHAITKMSHIHFPANDVYADRIIQLGEDPDRVFTVGAPCLDNIMGLEPIERRALARELGIPAERPWGLVTYHPVTAGECGGGIGEILSSLGNFPGIYWIFTLPNADAGNARIRETVVAYVDGNPGGCSLFDSLGRRRYLSMLGHSALMVGNSSSGIIEAPSFGLPVVNVGPRQKGRLRAANVIDVPECTADAVTRAIREAVSVEFRESLDGIDNPYYQGGASEKIVSVLKSIPLDGIDAKRFNDMVPAGRY